MSVPSIQHGPGHKELDKHRFLARFMDVFTTREDFRIWPRWRSMRRVVDAYYRDLLRLGNEKYVDGIAVRLGLNNELLESFVRENPWEYETL